MAQFFFQLWSIMTKAVNPSINLLVKYEDDISLSIPVGAKLSKAQSEIELKSIIEWAKNNHMSLNQPLHQEPG